MSSKQEKIYTSKIALGHRLSLLPPAFSKEETSPSVDRVGEVIFFQCLLILFFVPTAPVCSFLVFVATDRFKAWISHEFRIFEMLPCTESAVSFILTIQSAAPMRSRYLSLR